MARRAENVRMESFLAEHGIKAKVKYIRTGSTRAAWRLYNHSIPWSVALAERLTALGFRDLWDEPLKPYSGNGGLLSVLVRGHYELLDEGKEAAR